MITKFERGDIIWFVKGITILSMVIDDIVNHSDYVRYYDHNFMNVLETDCFASKQELLDKLR